MILKSISAALAAALAATAIVAYWPFLSLPFISDDYTQIRLARQYGGISGWGALALDPLYRCRATSLILTHWIDSWFGLSPLAHNSASLLIHVLNTCLIGAAGFWRRIGWPVSIPAAGFFAVYEGHQEAVVWNAALPELLVFFFAVASFLLWTAWLERPRWYFAALTVAGFLLALLSKESGVAILPMLAASWILHSPRHPSGFIPLAICSLLAIFYASSVFLSPPAHHLHLRDGTFSWTAPFWITLPNSLARMFWIWGLAALATLIAFRRRANWPLAAGATLWMAITLIPYSFLTYMTRVPSRHTYLASAGLAILIGLAWQTTLAQRQSASSATGLLAALLLFHNIGYLWVKKFSQYQRRAEPTLRFLDFARSQPGPILVRCTPYTVNVLRDTAVVVLGRSDETILEAPMPIGNAPAPVDYCDMEQP